MMTDAGWRKVAGERLSNRPPAVAAMRMHLPCQSGLNERTARASVDLMAATEPQGAQKLSWHLLLVADSIRSLHCKSYISVANSASIDARSFGHASRRCPEQPPLLISAT
jgi:hypothetical protein